MTGRVGICLSLTCGAAIAINLVFWNNSFKLAEILVFLCVGFLAGLGWSCVGRIPLLAAAMEADRQLGLKDLLSTAFQISRQSDEAWRRCVLALADERAKELSASQIAVKFFGARSWTVLVLGIALSATLSLFSSTREHAIASSVSDIGPQRTNPELKSAAGEVSRPPGQSPGDADSGRSFSGEVRTSDSANSDGGGKSQDGKSITSRTTGTAGGLGTTPVTVRDNGAVPSSDGAASVASGSGETASGVGKTSPQPIGAGESNGGIAAPGGASAHAPAAPWESDQWSAAQASAIKSIQTKQIDPTYADLVRDYFQHP
jgi:hypothetical protein